LLELTKSQILSFFATLYPLIPSYIYVPGTGEYCTKHSILSAFSVNEYSNDLHLITTTVLRSSEQVHRAPSDFVMTTLDILVLGLFGCDDRPVQIGRWESCEEIAGPSLLA